MIKRFMNLINKVFVGKQGIKTVYKGNQKVYERPGGYFYITLEK